MLKQFQYETTTDYEKAVQEAVGSDTEGFERKRARLFERWCEKRLFPNRVSEFMLRVVGKKLSPDPVNCALVSDNLEFFRSKYMDSYGQKPELALQIACVCGSKKVALFLLGVLETNLTDPKMHYLLEYIMTSDLEWAGEIAHAMIKAGQREMPEGMSVFPTMAEYLKIQGLFIRKEAEEEAEKQAISGKNPTPLSGKLEKK